MINKVIAGWHIFDEIECGYIGPPSIKYGLFGFKSIYLDYWNVKDYEEITTEEKINKKSSLMRGIVGGSIAGPLGGVIGLMKGKNKNIHKIYIEFVNGKESIIQMDDEVYFNFKKQIKMPTRIEPKESKKLLAGDK